ncbi:hypothetical protein CKY47_14085 [Saccharothrix yanglingensis]|uniref:Uncharacterized protein n=1 Tax=Saccharothrix yanglingensis TaxID=659496 RepID=A0ABU0X1D1_9PSEU|nr:hypothetical protein [Saccharothrix yanglingensis]
MTDEENPMTTDGRDGTRHVRMPVPPGGDADRHPGSRTWATRTPARTPTTRRPAAATPTRGAATASTGTRACRASRRGRRGR